MLAKTRITRRLQRASTLFSFLLAFGLAGAGMAEAQPAHGGRGGRGGGPGGGLGSVAGPGLPTVTEMADAVGANAEQRAALAEARLAFFEAREVRDLGGPEGRRAGHGRRGAHAGRGGLADPADPGPRMDRRNGPMQILLREAGEALSVEQMSALLDLLEARAPKQGPAADFRPRAGGRQGGLAGRDREPGPDPQGFGHPVHRGAWDDRLLASLGLTEEQRLGVRVLHASTRAALRTLAAQVAPGEEPSETLRARMQEIRDDYQEQLKTILGEAKSRRLEEQRHERHMANAARAEARWEKDRAERLATLDAVLDLKPRQREAIVQLLDEAHEKATAARMQHWEMGGPMVSLLSERGMDPRALDQAIAERLEPAQREVFAKLRALAVRGGRGPRPGCRR